jgi:hypothetical protein
LQSLWHLEPASDENIKGDADRQASAESTHRRSKSCA